MEEYKQFVNTTFINLISKQIPKENIQEILNKVIKHDEITGNINDSFMIHLILNKDLSDIAIIWEHINMKEIKKIRQYYCM